MSGILNVLIGLAVRAIVLPELRKRLGVDSVPAEIIATATQRVADALGSGELTVEFVEREAKTIALIVADEVLRSVEGKS